jgi:hypothetical protein
MHKACTGIMPEVREGLLSNGKTLLLQSGQSAHREEEDPPRNYRGRERVMGQMGRTGQALVEHGREPHGRSRRKNLQSSRRLTELMAWNGLTAGLG